MPEDFTDEFADADLKDVRRNRRLAKLAAALAKSPAASISAASGGWAETMAAFRLRHCEDFAPGALIAPHARATVARCAGQACVVVSQDTTEPDFSHMKATKDLGPLNDEHRRGFFMHSQYVVSEQGLPLGLLDAAIVLRDDATFRSAASRKQRPIADKESQRWLDGYQKASELARQLPDCEVISISDREGDIFEVYQAWGLAENGPRAGWIIRANQDRALVGVMEGEPAEPFAALESAPVLGEIEFEMRARKGTKKVKGNTVATFRGARTVRQVVRAMKITPRPPHRKGMKLKEVSFWAILAEETDPPAGEDPIRWLLLTSKEVNTLEEARRILYLTHLGRQCPDLPCGCVFEEAEWKSACAVVKRKKEAGEPSLSEFIGIAGKLGGHLGRKSDGAPGPQSIWQGLTRVRDFACAWQAFHGE